MLEYALKQERWVSRHPLLLKATHNTHIPQLVSNKCSVFSFYMSFKISFCFWEIFKSIPVCCEMLTVNKATFRMLLVKSSAFKDFGFWWGGVRLLPLSDSAAVKSKQERRQGKRGKVNRLASNPGHCFSAVWQIVTCSTTELNWCPESSGFKRRPDFLLFCAPVWFLNCCQQKLSAGEIPSSPAGVMSPVESKRWHEDVVCC